MAAAPLGIENEPSVLEIVPAEGYDDYKLAEVACPTKKVRLAAANENGRRTAARCALCAFAKCGEELTCKGKGEALEAKFEAEDEGAAAGGRCSCVKCVGMCGHAVEMTVVQIQGGVSWDGRWGLETSYEWMSETAGIEQNGRTKPEDVGDERL
ncbi:hypothetical protein GGX14DRAFT_571447 [Mycena pura]|uniref:Uncharacterized protein n=1 Tax=Mycena pura TaxID=153505 RepID=A0AAD6V6R5_9AGAR|nr:hypothetical protein GGX14DRAFT_571447 [Mycena pura]